MPTVTSPFKELAQLRTFEVEADFWEAYGRAQTTAEVFGILHAGLGFGPYLPRFSVSTEMLRLYLFYAGEHWGSAMDLVFKKLIPSVTPLTRTEGFYYDRTSFFQEHNEFYQVLLRWLAGIDYVIGSKEMAKIEPLLRTVHDHSHRENTGIPELHQPCLEAIVTCGVGHPETWQILETTKDEEAVPLLVNVIKTCWLGATSSIHPAPEPKSLQEAITAGGVKRDAAEVVIDLLKAMPDQPDWTMYGWD